MMFLLLDSALRSLLFGLSVWALLKVLRMRHAGTETIIWTLVLVVALAMPLLSHCLPQWILVVPRLSAMPHHPVAAAGSRGGLPIRFGLMSHVRTGLLMIYALGLASCLARLAIGLLQSGRLYARAVRVEANWARGRHIRVSAALKGPASMARVILLPADCCQWSVVKREAVLAHEGAHIARGDFFVQLLASLHCAFFWFSPFAWWLQSKLGEVAETASDEAAIEHLNDRVTYAEVLLEVARGAQPSPSIVAMAKGPFIEQRLERILSESPRQHPGFPLRALIIGFLPLVAIPLASAKATLDDLPSSPLSQGVSTVNSEAKTTPTVKTSVELHRVDRSRKSISRNSRPGAEMPIHSQSSEERVSYNPRALLDSAFAPDRPNVPASTIVHGANTYYIHSTEVPVADVPEVIAIHRRDN